MSIERNFDPEGIYEQYSRMPAAEFYIDLEPLPAQSDEKGIPQYREVEMVKWYYPGELGSVWRNTSADFFKKDPRYKDYFKTQYEAWKSGNTEAMTGTPLKECAAIPRTLAESFRFLGIKTVEQLVELEPTKLAAVPEGQEYQKAAKRWVEAAKKSADKTKLMKRIEDLEAENTALKKEIENVNKKFILLTGGN